MNLLPRLALGAFALGCLLHAACAETGIASIYWEGDHLATGARFNPQAVECAHKTLPLGTIVRITDLTTGKFIECPIEDRGPYVAGRIVDLSLGAARALGLSVAQGLASVRLEVVR